MGNSLLEQEPLKDWVVTVELCRNQFHFCQSRSQKGLSRLCSLAKITNHYIMII